MVEMRAMMARTGALVPQLKTPCYIPTSIVGSVPHLTPGRILCVISQCGAVADD